MREVWLKRVLKNALWGTGERNRKTQLSNIQTKAEPSRDTYAREEGKTWKETERLYIWTESMAQVGCVERCRSQVILALIASMWWRAAEECVWAIGLCSLAPLLGNLPALGVRELCTQHPLTPSCSLVPRCSFCYWFWNWPPGKCWWSVGEQTGKDSRLSQGQSPAGDSSENSRCEK